MPRKAYPLTGGIGPRQLAWNAIRAHVGIFTAEDIERATCAPGSIQGGVDHGTLMSYLQCLEAAGIVRVVKLEAVRGAARRKHYELLVDEGVEAPRLRRDGSRATLGIAQEQMWRTLRMLGCDVNARELAAHASSSACTVAESAARDYLQTLDRAGYLIRTREAGKANGASRYRLNPAKNTGPKPPMICRARVVFDANLQEVVFAPTVTEEDADHGR